MAADLFSLQWNDFQDNLSGALAESRKDHNFTNVTLVSADNQKIKAHKLILSISSGFFKNILETNDHSHPLIYMRSLTLKDLIFVVDFIYNGQIKIPQDHLEEFLTIGNELQLKGLTGDIEHSKQTLFSNEIATPLKLLEENNTGVDNYTSYPRIITENITSQGNNVKNESVWNPDCNIVNTNDKVIIDTEINTTIITVDEEELDRTIETMMEKVDSVWTCNICGKNSKHKTHLQSHIESIHTTGHGHLCQMCKKSFKSRGSLQVHISRHHRNA